MASVSDTSKESHLRTLELQLALSQKIFRAYVDNDVKCQPHGMGSVGMCSGDALQVLANSGTVTLKSNISSRLTELSNVGLLRYVGTKKDPKTKFTSQAWVSMSPKHRSILQEFRAIGLPTLSTSYETIRSINPFFYSEHGCALRVLMPQETVRDWELMRNHAVRSVAKTMHPDRIKAEFKDAAAFRDFACKEYAKRATDSKTLSLSEEAITVMMLYRKEAMATLKLQARPKSRQTMKVQVRTKTKNIPLAHSERAPVPTHRR